MRLLAGERVRIRSMREADLEGDTGWARMDSEKLRELYWKGREDPQRGIFVILKEGRERIGRIEYVATDPQNVERSAISSCQRITQVKDTARRL
jgi:hypothetical protein